MCARVRVWNWTVCFSKGPWSSKLVSSGKHLVCSFSLSASLSTLSLIFSWLVSGCDPCLLHSGPVCIQIMYAFHTGHTNKNCNAQRKEGVMFFFLGCVISPARLRWLVRVEESPASKCYTTSLTWPFVHPTLTRAHTPVILISRHHTISGLSLSLTHTHSHPTWVFV